MSWFKMDQCIDKTPSLLIFCFDNLKVWFPHWPFKFSFQFLSKSISLFYIFIKGKCIMLSINFQHQWLPHIVILHKIFLKQTRLNYLNQWYNFFQTMQHRKIWNKIMLRNKLWNSLTKKLEYLIASPQAFITALILSNILSFINSKQYSLSKWFQFY